MCASAETESGCGTAEDTAHAAVRARLSQAVEGDVREIDTASGIGSGTLRTTERGIDMFADNDSLTNRRRTLLAILAVCGLLGGPAFGDEKLKVTTWRYRGTSKNNVGTWNLNVFADANCGHGTAGPLFGEDHGTWLIGDSVSLVTLGPVEAKVLTDARGKATSRVAVTVPKVVNDHVWPWHYETSARNRIDIESEASKCFLGKSRGRAAARSFATLPGGAFVKSELDGQLLEGRVGCSADWKWFGLHGGSLNGGAIMNDPIVLTLHNESDNHSVVRSETLFRFDAVATFDDATSGWGIDEAGLTIASGANQSGEWKSKVLISGEAASPWLVNPLGAFSVSLEGGVFQSTGYWSSLWQLTIEDGRVTTAFLPLADLPFAIDYVIPIELLNDTDTYSQSLSTQFMIDEFHENVPGPGVCAVVGIGMLGAVLRRRR
ncbi:MAG: hypothetical protein GIKADHBN_01299 [Phycisphaerales bacterium]|nr:hypothetical protein [Phycisphaerales bacterium]